MPSRNSTFVRKPVSVPQAHRHTKSSAVETRGEQYPASHFKGPSGPFFCLIPVAFLMGASQTQLRKYFLRFGAAMNGLLFFLVALF